MKLKIDLTKNGDLTSLIDTIEKKYTNYESKAEIFVRRLAELGIPIVDRGFASVNTRNVDTSHKAYVDMVTTQGGITRTSLIVEGKELLFIEFGTGVHYNGSVGSSPHPKGNELGYRIGEYNGQKYSKGQHDLWVYNDESGEPIFTHVIKSQAPVYSASVQMILDMKRIAKEVFEVK